jgi:L-iditol 2-dehydrogenase
MSFSAAAAVEPVAVLVHATNLVELAPGETVAIMGAGPIGLLALQVAKIAGASKVVIGDKIPHRLQRARELGADQVVDVSKESMAEAVMDVTGKGAHAIYDCAGKPQSINAALSSVRPGGRIVLIGIPSQIDTPINFWQGLQQEVTIRVQKRNNGNDHEALELIASGKIDPASILTHRFDFADGDKAFQTMGQYSDGVIKPWIEI